MSEKIMKRRLADRKRGLTDWARVDSMSEDELERAIAGGSGGASARPRLDPRSPCPAPAQAVHPSANRPGRAGLVSRPRQGLPDANQRGLRTYVEAHRDQPQTPLDRG